MGHRPEVILGLGTPPARATPDPAAGELVQAALTATARLDQHKKITAVRVSGRPKGRFKSGAQGSHVTAFGIFRDVLESATLGRTVTEAYANVDTLVDDLEALPGYSAFGKDLPEGRVTAGDTNDVQVHELQQLMVYYLEARDAAGYSAAFLGPGLAKGKGEGSILRRLRELENEGGLLGDEISEAKELVEGLYDTDAVDELARSASKPSLGKKRRARAWRQHVMTVSQAFPEVYADLHDDDATTYPDVSKEISRPEPEDGYQRATGRDLFQNLGVMARPNKKGGYELDVSGRPAGPFSQGSKMGSHTIAYSLVVEGLTRRLATARRASAVRRRLLAMLKSAKKSPTRRFEKNLRRNARARFREADSFLDAAIRRLETLKPAEVDASDVEAAAEALILQHNTSPLSAVDLGLANNKGEQFSLSQLRSYEQGDLGKQPDASIRATAVDRVYQLLDGETISRLASNDRRTTNLPGAEGNATEEIAAIFDAFFEHVERAFPSVYTQALPHHKANIAYYLGQRLGLMLDADVVTAKMKGDVATGSLARGSSLEALDKRQRNTGKRKSRRHDEQDFVFTGKITRPRKRLRRSKRRRKAPVRFI